MKRSLYLLVGMFLIIDSSHIIFAGRPSRRSSSASSSSSRSSSSSESDHEQDLYKQLEKMGKAAKAIALSLQREIGFKLDLTELRSSLKFEKEDDFNKVFALVPVSNDYQKLVSKLQSYKNKIHQIKYELKTAGKGARHERKDKTIMVVDREEQCWFIRPWDKKSNYDTDDVNFAIDQLDARIDEICIDKTVAWTVLVNMHANVPLVWGGNVPRGDSRSLSWTVPYLIAVDQFKTVGDVHTKSALPLSWGQGKYRNMVSFLFIPPNSKLEFKIGYAKEQTDSVYLYDRTGYGVQMRLKSIPAGTIVVTNPLVNSEQKKRSKEYKKLDLQQNLQHALDVFNQSNERKDLKLSELSLGELTQKSYTDIDSFLNTLGAK